MTMLRVCFIGDSITAGTGDSELRGWPGRLALAETRRGHDLTIYNLGIRSDTSPLIAARWHRECEARIPPHVPSALVFAFGVNDVAQIEGETDIRVSCKASLEAARSIIGAAAEWLPVLWIGPAPVDDARQPLRPGLGTNYCYDNERIAALSEAFAGLATELGVPYLPLFPTLQFDPVWMQALAEGDGVHPAREGYRLIARLIEEHATWRSWFGFADEISSTVQIQFAGFRAARIATRKTMIARNGTPSNHVFRNPTATSSTS